MVCHFMITLLLGLRSTYMSHAYDFYKPDMSSEYPVVDGALSVKSYTTALDNCYMNYLKKLKTLKDKQQLTSDSPLTMKDIDYMVFHTPYCKLVQKSVGRCMFLDYLSCRDRSDCSSIYDAFAKYK